MSFIRKLNIRNSTIIKSIGIYTFTNFFSKAVSFLLLFIYTNPKYINPSENGLLSLMSNSIVFVMPFIALGALHSVSTDFFKLDKKDFKNFFTTSFIMPVIVTIFCFAGLFFFRNILKENYGFPFSFVWLIPVIVFFTFCNEHLINLVRNNNEPRRFLIINLSKTAIEFGLSVILVVAFAWRWQGRVAGILAAFSFSALYAFYYFKKKDYLFGTIKKQYIYNELIYALPIVVMQASLFCLNSADKFFLSHFTADNNATVGIYSIGYTFASVVSVLSTALLQYIYPKIYTYLGQTEKDYRGIKKHFIFYFFVMLTGTIMIIIAAPILYYYFINARYYTALQYIYIICIGNFLWAINYFFYSFFFFEKQKKKILLVSISSILISCILNYFLIRKGLALGAGIATALSYFFVLIITLYVNRMHIKKMILS